MYIYGAHKTGVKHIHVRTNERTNQRIEHVWIKLKLHFQNAQSSTRIKLRHNERKKKNTFCLYAFCTDGNSLIFFPAFFFSLLFLVIYLSLFRYPSIEWLNWTIVSIQNLKKKTKRKKDPLCTHLLSQSWIINNKLEYKIVFFALTAYSLLVGF